VESRICDGPLRRSRPNGPPSPRDLHAEPRDCWRQRAPVQGLFYGIPYTRIPTARLNALSRKAPLQTICIRNTGPVPADCLRWKHTGATGLYHPVDGGAGMLHRLDFKINTYKEKPTLARSHLPTRTIAPSADRTTPGFLFSLKIDYSRCGSSIFVSCRPVPCGFSLHLLSLHLGRSSIAALWSGLRMMFLALCVVGVGSS